MVKEWIANALLDGLRLFSQRAHDWFFDPVRQARRRFADRERWWAYREKALATPGTRDDMRATALQIRFKFETSPEDAVVRGDLDMAARRLAMDAVDAARRAQGWSTPPAGYVSPDAPESLR